PFHYSQLSYDLAQNRPVLLPEDWIGEVPADSLAAGAERVQVSIRPPARQAEISSGGLAGGVHSPHPLGGQNAMGPLLWRIWYATGIFREGPAEVPRPLLPQPVVLHIGHGQERQNLAVDDLVGNRP